MNRRIAAFFNDYLRPMIQRPDRIQTAALCHRGRAAGREVLLITSRDTGRWVVPKGNLMRGLDAAGAAVAEAWEEAGVRPVAPPSGPVGKYRYRKITDTGLPLRVRVIVFPVEVAQLAEDFPEAGQRDRRWFRPEEAADLVREPGLQAILRRLAVKGSVTERL